jgi:hypothetical protein
MSEQRFDRIEEKLDKLTDAITQIVRVEEKLVANDKRVDRLEYRADMLETDLDGVAQIARKNQGVVTFADKFFWLLIGGLISFGVWLARVGIQG